MNTNNQETFREQRLVKVFDQNQKHVEVQNQRTGTPSGFMCHGRAVRISHQRFCIRKLLLKFFAISTGNTCVGVYLLKTCRPQHRCFPENIAKLLPMVKV